MPWPSPAQNVQAVHNPLALIDFNFQTGVYLESGVSSTLATAPGWTFSRTTTGYGADVAGALTSFAIDAPRVTNRGLLIEAAATNHLLQSQTFDNVGWVAAIGGTGLAPVVTADAAVAPDGTTTADQVVFNLAAGTGNGDISMLSEPVTGLVAAAPYRGGLYLRAATPCNLLIRHAGGGGYTTVAVTTAWQRLGAQETAFGTASDFQFGLRSGVFGSLGSATVLVWGGQLEAGTAFSSYIPTTSGTVTRGADVASIGFTGASQATIVYGGGLIANVAVTTSLNLGAASGGAWVGSYVERVVVR